MINNIHNQNESQPAAHDSDFHWVSNISLDAIESKLIPEQLSHRRQE